MADDEFATLIGQVGQLGADHAGALARAADLDAVLAWLGDRETTDVYREVRLRVYAERRDQDDIVQEPRTADTTAYRAGPHGVREWVVGAGGPSGVGDEAEEALSGLAEALTAWQARS